MKTHLAVYRTHSTTKDRLDEFISTVQRYGRAKEWSATRKFGKNDLVLFYFGKPAMSIVAVGFAASDWYILEGPFDWTTKKEAPFCDFKPVWLLENPIPLLDASNRAGLQHWYGSSPFRHSRELEPEIAQSLVGEVIRLNPGIRPLLYKGRIEAPATLRLQRRQIAQRFQEGGVQEITVELTRRNPQLRTRAIVELGYTCQACGFNFGDVYGELGLGYIEVHHKRPLSDRGRQHIATTKDVNVVCANCHRVLHRNGKKPISIEKLRKVVADQKRHLK